MKRPSGLTLLELLVVISVIGILLAVGVPALRPPSAYLFASDLKTMIQQARFESIKRNAPVALVWRSNNQAFVTQLHPTNATVNQACNTAGMTVLRTKNLTDYRNVSVESDSAQNGVVWLPTGLMRWCDGSFVAAGTDFTGLTDGRATYDINISSAGQVDIEKRL